MLRMISCTVSVAVMAWALAGCTTTPGAVELPPDDPSTAADTRPIPPAPLPPLTPDEEPQPTPRPVEMLEHEGVRGGKIAFEVDAAKDDVLDMLLDFDRAAGHRAWAKSYSVVSRTPDRVVSHWEFEGKSGVNPAADLVFDVVRRKTDVVVRFKLREPVFGLGAFFGDWRVTPIGASRTRLTMRVYIDSGVWIANATEDDIVSGLREDADLMIAWLAERARRPAP
jgi:hypothetical protein